MENVKGKIIAGLVLGALAIGALLFVFYHIFVLKEPVCKLSSEEPLLVSNSSRSIASDDHKALANFTGYLIYQSIEQNLKMEDGDQIIMNENSISSSAPKKKYLNLNFESVNYVRSAGLLGLNSDCSRIELALDGSTISSTGEKQLKVQEILVNMKVPNGNVTACTIKEPNISIPKQSHYFCNKKTSYSCEASGKAIAQLIVVSLEFEIDGDSEKTKQGKYTFKPQVC